MVFRYQKILCRGDMSITRQRAGDLKALADKAQEFGNETGITTKRQHQYAPSTSPRTRTASRYMTYPKESMHADGIPKPHSIGFLKCCCSCNPSTRMEVGFASSLKT